MDLTQQQLDAIYDNIDNLLAPEISSLTSSRNDPNVSNGELAKEILSKTSELTSQELDDVEYGTDNSLTTDQKELIASSRNNVSMSLYEFGRWFVKKLNDWLE